MELSENFQDDLLQPGEEKKRYKMITNSDGTISLDDVTNYLQRGSRFGAEQVNQITHEINEINKILNSKPRPEPEPGQKVYKKMTVRIDLSNRNPETCITYQDDAVGMAPKSEAWDEFFGHYPVLLKNGAEVGKLKKADFSKLENGSPADITSGNAGDVMIAFPRRGVKISTSGNIVTVSMTDDPDNLDYKYYAHERGGVRKEKFYLGVYKGWTYGGKLRSLSGKTPTANQTIGTFRNQAHALGDGYENSGFYQLVFRQVMYLLRDKNLDSQISIGRGWTNQGKATTTGSTNAKGMNWGEQSGKQQMKLFGLEDFWGNVWEWIDGIVTDSTRNILTATDKFNDSGSEYTNRGQGATSDIDGWLSEPQGTTETGFLAKKNSGSASTYFCDYIVLHASCAAYFGGNWRYGFNAGAFSLSEYPVSYSYEFIGARLMYL